MMRANWRDQTRMRRCVGGSKDLAQEVENLSVLDAAALRQRWAKLFGAEPSSRIGRTLMIQAIAYRLQERALGGLKSSTQRILDRVWDGRAEVAVKRTAKRRAGAGTVFVREWRGVSHGARP